MRVQEKNEPREQSDVSLTEYITKLWRKKYFILIPVVLSGLISTVGVRFIKPVFMSSALIRMEDKTYLSGDVAQMVTIEERRTAFDEETHAKITSEIRSADFLDEVISHLGIADNPQLVANAEKDRREKFPTLTTGELVARRLRDMLSNKIEVSMAGPGMFRISCFDYSPETSHVLANAVTELFIESQRTVQLRGLQQASEFSDEQLQIYKARLEESEAEVQKIQNEITRLALQSNPVGETSVEYLQEFGGGANLRQAETLKEQLDAQVRELDDIVEKTRNRLTDLVGHVPSSSALSDDALVIELKQELTSYWITQLRLDLAPSGVTADDAERNMRVIRDTENDLQRRLTHLVEISFADVGADFRPLVTEYYLSVARRDSQLARRARLVAYIDAFKAKLNVVPQLENRLEKMKEEVATNRELYNSFLMAKTTAEVSEAAHGTELGMSISVIENAMRPFYPVKPNKKHIVLLAIIFGAALGVGGLVVSEYADTSFRTVDEIEKKLGLKVLGAVPSIDPKTGWDEARNRRQVVIWLATSVVVITVTLFGFFIYGKVIDKQAIRLYTVESVRK